MNMNSAPNKLLLENKAWSEEIHKHNPEFFKRLAASQSPSFLWIGCSDSRVPPNVITNTMPGEVFVHRNIANMVIEDDLSVLSVIQYAVEVLKIEHVIVCGHYNCGGVAAALQNQKLGIIDGWLSHIRKVYLANKAEVDACPDDEAKARLMVELNVRQQVISVRNTESVQKMWEKSESPTLHGWVYGLEDGLIKELTTISRGQ